MKRGMVQRLVLVLRRDEQFWDSYLNVQCAQYVTCHLDFLIGQYQSSSSTKPSMGAYARNEVIQVTVPSRAATNSIKALKTIRMAPFGVSSPPGFDSALGQLRDPSIGQTVLYYHTHLLR